MAATITFTLQMATASCRLQLILIHYSFLLNIEKVKDKGILKPLNYLSGLDYP